MDWEPRHSEVFWVSPAERDLYAARDPQSSHHEFQFPRKGIHGGGEFPVAVVRKVYAQRGFDCWISAQSKHGIPSYLLERMPRIRHRPDPAYLKTLEFFGGEPVQRVHDAARAARQAERLRAAGGDPDLLVQRRGQPEERFFVEVKLEDLTKPRPYRDSLNRQQHILFPIIEAELGCEVRLAIVSVLPPQT